jgi:ankyrin repeat protein
MREVNTRNNNGSTPLLESIKRKEEKNFDVVQLLLDHNADVRVHDNKGNTPLHLAAESGRLEIARILLKSNAEVNSRNDDGYTPLSPCIEEGIRPDVALLLLDHNADVLVHDNSGNTPLQYAARNGFLEVARTLLERNAEVNSQNYHGSTPLLLASELDTLILCSYCWTIMLMWMCAMLTVTLHCIAQRMAASSRSLGYYSSSMWRSIPGTTWD